jgi:hypothetical protein
MFRSATLSGRDGATVQWGYHCAASLASWSLSANGATGTLTATVGEADPFKLEQPGLKFCVIRQTGLPWEWPITALHIADRTITATVDLQE